MSMAWPGSELPSHGKRPRVRRKRIERPINASSSTRVMLALARKLGIALPAKRTTEGVGRCLPHACEDPLLGFPDDPWGLALYLDALSARRNPRGKKRRKVVLPPEKSPRGVVAVGVPCPHCTKGCTRCDWFSWGLLYKVPIRKRARECKQHEAAPATPATAVLATPPASPAPPTTSPATAATSAAPTR